MINKKARFWILSQKCRRKGNNRRLKVFQVGPGKTKAHSLAKLPLNENFVSSKLCSLP